MSRSRWMSRGMKRGRIICGNPCPAIRERTACDAADGRFIPQLTIHARFINSQGYDVGMHQQPFIWHPWVYHGGRNWHVAEEGDYTLEVSIKAPSFPRHDKKNGQRYTDDVDVTFNNVKILL